MALTSFLMILDIFIDLVAGPVHTNFVLKVHLLFLISSHCDFRLAMILWLIWLNLSEIATVFSIQFKVSFTSVRVTLVVVSRISKCLVKEVLL